MWVSPQFEGAQFVPATTSNPDGTYRIDDIEPGPYLVGFGNDVRWSTYPVEWYDDAALEEDAAPVEFDYGDEVTIDAELEQVGVLEWNFDSVGFEAVAPICAYATNADGKRVAETTGTVGGATFLGGLPSGDYLLYAEGCDTSDPEVAPVWYPDATTRSGAEVLHVDGHLVDLGNWDLSDVIPGPSSVSGVTTLGGVAINACVTVFDEDMAVVGEAAAVDGSYSVDGLDLHGPEAGLYVKAEDCGDPTVAAWYGSATGQDAIEIPYGAGLAWSDIDIELSGVETNELTVTVEDLLARPLASVCTVVSGDAEVDGRTGADGTVSFTLSDGDYTVTAGVAGTGCVTGYEEATESVSVAGPTSVSIALALPVEFADTQDSVFAADIDWLAGAGVTKGCNPPLNTEYCATQVVTRGQMAAFLARALSLTDRLDNPFTDDDGIRVRGGHREAGCGRDHQRLQPAGQRHVLPR